MVVVKEMPLVSRVMLSGKTDETTLVLTPAPPIELTPTPAPQAVTLPPLERVIRLQKLREQVGPPLTDDEVLTIRKGLEQQKTDAAAQIKVMEEKLKPAELLRQQFIEKYGTPDQPRSTISDTYSFQQFEYPQLEKSSVQKGREFIETLSHTAQLAEGVTTDIHNLSRVRTDTELNTLLPQLQKIQETSPDIPKSFVSPTGEHFEINDAVSLLKYISYLSRLEVDYLRHDFSARDVLRLDAVTAELREKRPQLSEETGNPEEALAPLDGILKNVISGYPDRMPKLVVHPDRESFLKSHPALDLKNVAAYHHPTSDTIHTSKGTVLDHLYTLAHEYGHPITFSNERALLSTIEGAEQQINTLRQLQDTIVKSLQKLDEYEKATSEDERLQAQSQLIELDQQASLRLLDFFGANLDGMTSLADVFRGATVEDQLDEAGAFLVQDIVLNQWAKDNSEVGMAMLQYRDLQCEIGQDVTHYGAYRLARELKAEHGGDSVAAWRHLAGLADKDVIQKYRDRIDTLNDMGGVSSFSFRDLSKGFAAADIKDAIADRVFPRNLEWTNEFLDHLRENRDMSPEFISNIENRVRKEERALSEYLIKYLRATSSK